MIIDHSQDIIKIEIPDQIINVGVRISGGVDSAILTYLLGKYKSEERPDINLIPITLFRRSKPFNQVFAEKVLRFVEKEFNIIFNSHYIVGNTLDLVDQSEATTKLLNMLYREEVIQIHFVGITSTPLNTVKGLTDDLDHITGLDRSPQKIKPKIQGVSYRPLYNIDKKGVAELYNKFNLTDRLFPLTRSCEESYPKDFDVHCGECWWCRERFWAFGRYK